MKARYKNRQMDLIFNIMLGLARHREAELVFIDNKGFTFLRTGGSHRTAFWRGYHHTKLGGRIPDLRGSLGFACYMAGKEFRKETDEFVGLANSATGLILKDCA